MIRTSCLRRRCVAWLYAAGIPLLAGVVHAQTPLPVDDDIFILPDFTITTEGQEGYRATNTVSGTRLNQNVKELPIPVDIITEDFIRDTGALTVTEALQFTAGLETEITSQQPGENPGATGFRLRGFVSQAVLRNGFRREGGTDTINVGQVDVIRGPNALLYGIGNFGGVVNYVTKQPLSTWTRQAQVITGSWGFYRGSFDVTGPLTDQIGIRLPMFYQTRNDWFDHLKEDRWGIAPILAFEPWENTRITIETEYFRTESTVPEDPISPAFRAPDALGFIDTELHPGTDGFLSYPSRSFRYAGPDTYRHSRDVGVLGQVTHRFSDTFSINLGYYWSQTRSDSRTAGVSLSQIPELLSESATGQRNRALYPWAYNPLDPNFDAWSEEGFYALQYNWNRGQEKRTRTQARIEAAYAAEAFNLEHTFLAGITYDKLDNYNIPWGFRDANREPVSISANDTTGLQGVRARYQSIHNHDPLRFEPEPGQDFHLLADPIRNFISWAGGYYLIHQTAFADRRFRTISGLRYDKYQIARESRYTPLESQELTGTNELVGRAKPHVHQNPTSKANYSFGLSYTPNRVWTLFALTASALDPSTTGGQRIATGFVPDPQSGQSYEIGTKADFLDGRISGALSIYHIDRENVAVPQSQAGNHPVPLPQGLSDPESPFFDPDWVAQGRAEPGRASLREDRSQGLDTQFFFIDFIPNFETIVSASYNRYRIRDHQFFMYQGKQDGEFVFRQVSATQWRDETGTPLPWNDDRLNNDTPKYTFRLWNKYTFRDGTFRGLDLSLGLSWTDAREAMFAFEDDPSYKIIPRRTSVSGAVGYRRTIRGLDCNFRLNLNNLTNDRTVYGYNYSPPRSFRLSATVNF
ncbi:MAG: hypothetical protein EA425_01865 [Puniceicoccaceae bacterium]|nr:MAG: hypothetical protein EA425_01865 [Puniceicoccaceae bacterium]